MGIILIMEYLPHSLYDVIKDKDTVLNEPEIKCYMKMILSGVEYMHKNHIMHRVSFSGEKMIPFRYNLFCRI